MQDTGGELLLMGIQRSSHTRRSPKLVSRNVHLAYTSLLASLLECPGSMQGREGGTRLLPTRNSEGRSAVRKRSISIPMRDWIVDMLEHVS
jgi:hypothetical protein